MLKTVKHRRFESICALPRKEVRKNTTIFSVFVAEMTIAANQVGILFGAVTWPHAQDIAPETLLAEMLPLDPNLAPTDIASAVQPPSPPISIAE